MRYNIYIYIHIIQLPSTGHIFSFVTCIHSLNDSCSPFSSQVSPKKAQDIYEKLEHQNASGLPGSARSSVPARRPIGRLMLQTSPYPAAAAAASAQERLTLDLSGVGTAQQGIREHQLPRFGARQLPGVVATFGWPLIGVQEETFDGVCIGKKNQLSQRLTRVFCDVSLLKNIHWLRCAA